MIRLAAPLLALFLLAGVALDKSSRSQPPAGAAEYHAQVRDAIQAIPYRIGDWVGVDTEIRQEALRILDANVSLSRTYKHLGTGQTASLLIVQCADSRSLLGHYPPVCYPSQGWTQRKAVPREIDIDSATLAATEYEFAFETLSDAAQLGVLHFTVLPDGRTALDMDLLEVFARDTGRKYLGGASLQFIADARLPESDRDECYRMLYRAASQWIKAMQFGTAS